MKSKPTIGWIGTGIMGFHMCRYLLNKGYDLSVYNRTASKAEGLLSLGAKWRTPQEIASNVDILFLMLGFPRDVEEMCLGQGKILEHMRAKSILVDHTTSSPSLAMKIHKRTKQKGIVSIDAPVSGGQIGAKEGRLIIMCGGEKEKILQIAPVMECYSRKVQDHGVSGKGQHAKMANQIVVAGNLAGMAQGLLYASKMGLDLPQTIQTLSMGAASSVSLTVTGKKIVNNDFNPGFYVEHFVKDMEIALDEAARVNLSLPCLALIKQLYTAVKARGMERLGTQALIKVLEEMNNHKVV